MDGYPVKKITGQLGHYLIAHFIKSRVYFPHKSSFLELGHFTNVRSNGHIAEPLKEQQTIKNIIITFEWITGGDGGIRTHDRVTPIHTFQACAFDHSATSPHPIREGTPLAAR